jgi:hypothetical protein
MGLHAQKTTNTVQKADHKSQKDRKPHHWSLQPRCGFQNTTGAGSILPCTNRKRRQKPQFQDPDLNFNDYPYQHG